MDSLIFHPSIYSWSSVLQTPSLAASQTEHSKLNQDLTNFQTKRRKEEVTMTSAKMMAQLTKNWQRMASLGRKRLTRGAAKESDECCSSMAVKGHCVVYTADERRFEVPLAYLGNRVFEELLQMSQEEFGFTSDEWITLPCDASTMEYAMCLLRRSVSAEVEKAFLSTMELPCVYATCVAPSAGVSLQAAVCSS